MNLKELTRQGQSVWLDFISRKLICNGDLKRLVENDGVRGVTSNPTIFEKAIVGSTDYDQTLRALLSEDPDADVDRSVYDETDAADGYVSLEVSPHLAHDTQATIAEARRLRAEVDRPNVMIKVPA